MNRTLSPPVPTQPTRRRIRTLSWLCLLLLCSPYIQGGLVKALDFPGAMAEMRHFGLAPAGPLALATIVGELAASFLVLAGIQRWAGAAYLALFTFLANLVANRFWELEGPARSMLANSFFEHLALVGALLFVAWFDRRGRYGPA